MAYPENPHAFDGRYDGEGDDMAGCWALDAPLPDAVRALDDEELCALLVALLQEWRDRAGGKWQRG